MPGSSRDPLDWAKRPFVETKRLRDELRMTRARLAALEEERTSYLRNDRRAGVLTRDAFRGAAAAALRSSQRSGAPAALVLVDIDGFRALNGRRGAAAGDDALAEVGRTLRGLVRAGDVVGRTGADELAAVMPGAGIEGARSTGQRLVTALERSGSVTVSVGVAVDSGATDLDGLLADAAEGLERARRAGGAQVGDTRREAQAAPDAGRGAVGALALTLAARDPHTGEHSEKVVALASAVAQRLGLDHEESERVAAAALLHDVGKIAVPDAILHKPGPLTDEERDVLHGHPVVGERILRAVPGMGPIARMVRHAHERYDGAGYPDGLRGDEIPLGSRIVQACDAYDAMTSARPFRAALSHQAAMSELVAGAGSQFDAQVVDALLHHFAARRPLDYAVRA